MNVYLKQTFIFLVVFSFGASEIGAEENEGEKLFTLKVLPLLKVKCFGCHGQDQKDIRGDYDLMTRQKMIAGGETGDEALVPGKPDESPLFHPLRAEADWDQGRRGRHTFLDEAACMLQP